MVGLYVRMQVAGWRVVRRLREERDGLSMIEYGVMAAFLILVLIGAAHLMGNTLYNWIKDTLNKLVSGQASTPQ